MLTPSLRMLSGRRSVAFAAVAVAVAGAAVIGYNSTLWQSQDIKWQRRVSAERGSPQDGAAKSGADPDARRQAEAEAERQVGDAARRKGQPAIEEPRVIAAALNAEERAALVKRVQEALKVNQCYQGAVNGSSSDTQLALDRFVESARKKGLQKPARIELATAAVSDFDSWLREAGDVKGGMCAPAARPRPAERPRRIPNYPSSRGGGGQGGSVIQGVQ
jgi:hypothetical protein